MINFISFGGIQINTTEGPTSQGSDSTNFATNLSHNHIKHSEDKIQRKRFPERENFGNINDEAYFMVYKSDRKSYCLCPHQRQQIVANPDAVWFNTRIQ